MASRPRWIPCVRPGARRNSRGSSSFPLFDPWLRRAGQIDRQRLLPAAAPAVVPADAAAAASSPSPPVGDFFLLDPFLALLRRLRVGGEDQDHTIFL
jgi:hypothetical protein